MNRADLQKLSNARIREARILLAAGEYSGAYYLAGYAVECALKACFAKGVQRFDFPDKDRAGKIFTHKLNVLATLANLDDELAKSTQASSSFAGSWSLAKSWSEESRYSFRTKDEAKSIIDAVVRKDGVLPWIKRRW
jgi:hypothetical protein